MGPDPDEPEPWKEIIRVYVGLPIVTGESARTSPVGDLNTL